MRTTLGDKERYELNAKHAADPKPGDRWDEMYHYWLYVVWRDGDLVLTAEAGAPCTFPKDAKWSLMTVEEFGKKVRYKSSYDNFVLWFNDSGNDVSWAGKSPLRHVAQLSEA